MGIGTSWAKKNYTRKVNKIHKGFELYQVLMHNHLGQSVPIPSNCILPMQTESIFITSANF